MQFKPDLMTFQDGTKVESKDQWGKRRQELMEILWREEYGYPLAPPEQVTGIVTEVDKKCACGRAVMETVTLSFPTEKGSFTFPMRFFVPNDGKKHPTVVVINFRPEPYDKGYPAEEILEHGFALGVICYKDVTSDDGDFSNGLAGHYTRPTDGTGWGKISLWAFAISRALDYLETREEVDEKNFAVAGHSRLGKTALLCAAQDERVKFVLVNDSGCGGAALEQTKHEGAETILHMSRKFPYWFCENRSKYADPAVEMPFDQHFLVACVAPRFVAIGSASLDNWADQYSEQLSALAASPAWEILGKAGAIVPEEPAAVGAVYNEGSVSYHLRDGIHFFGRPDWLVYLDFIERHLQENG